MLNFLIAAVVVTVGALVVRALYRRVEETGTPRAIRYKKDLLDPRILALRDHYSKVRAKFGNANPGVLFAIGAILTVFFALALRTTFATYSWLFLGLGWSESSANLYAFIPFTIVFVFALVVKMCLWPLAKSFFWKDEPEGASNFGYIVATVVGLILFTGVVLQLAPVASVRSERYIGPDVVAAQEDLSALEAECGNPATVRPSCEAELATAESELVSAETRLANGKKVDRIMATIVPFGELVTAFGPLMLIEVLSLVTIPFLRMRSAEKKSEKLGLNLAIKNGDKEPKEAVDLTDSQVPEVVPF